MTKVLVVWPKARKYNEKTWKYLGEKFGKENIKFIFTHNTKKEIDELKYLKGLNINYYAQKTVLTIWPFLLKDMLKTDFDVLITTEWVVISWVSTFIARIRKKKIVLITDNWGVYKKLLYRIFDFITALILPSKKLLLVRSKKAENYFKKKEFYKKSQIGIIPMGGEYEYKENKKEQEFLNEKKPYILSVGRFVKLKGFDYLIKSFNKIKDKIQHNLIIVGTRGEEEENLKKLISELNLNNRVFLLSKKHEDFGEYYKNASCLILSTINYKTGDAWGLVVNEAMQFSIPIISTDAAGVAGAIVIDNYNGFVVPQKNIEKMSLAILKLLELNKDNIMGKRSKEIIKHYTYKEEAESIYKNIINYIKQK